MKKIKKPSKIDEDISNIRGRATMEHWTHGKVTDPKKLGKMRVQYAAAAERAETAATKGHRSNKQSTDYFADIAAENYKRAGDISRQLKDYEGAANFYESSVRNYDRLIGEIELPPVYKKMELQKEKDARRLAKKMRRKVKHSGLIKKIFPISFILIFIVGIFFLSPNLTGNAIVNLTNQTSNIIGGALFVIGIVGALMWFKKR